MPKIIVKSKGASFRRAGIKFTREGVEVDTEELSQEAIDAIANEPNLIVVGELPAAEEADAGGKRKKGASK